MVVTFNRVVRRARDIMVVLTVPILVSIPWSWSSPKRLAIPDVVVEAGIGTGSSSWPAASPPAPVPADQEILTVQLGRGHGDHQFSAGQAAGPFFHRPAPDIQGAGQAQDPVHLRDRLDPDHRRRPLIRGSDPHLQRTG